MNNNNQWPDGTPKSWGNAFTHGYLGEPHGYTPDAPVAPAKLPQRKAKGNGFAAHNGTLHGMGRGTQHRRNELQLRRIA
jgi:hypothetical protein